VIFPRADWDEPPYALQAPAGSPFVALFERAEYWAFVRKDHDRAAALYRQCRPLTEIAACRLSPGKAWDAVSSS